MSRQSVKASLVPSGQGRCANCISGEDTTGSKVGLHYLRDKERREVDFLAAVDHRPTLLVEVKTGDDAFAPPLFRFRQALAGPRAVQVVDGLSRRKEKDGVEMHPADHFPAALEIGPPGTKGVDSRQRCGIH